MYMKRSLSACEYCYFARLMIFLKYRNLSGYSVKGHHACPIYEENTSYHELKYGRNTCYIGHQRFFKRNHPYRRLEKSFLWLSRGQKDTSTLNW